MLSTGVLGDNTANHPHTADLGPREEERYQQRGTLRSHVRRALLAFVDSVHGSLELDQLGARYVQAIPDLIPANAYGFYLLNAPSGRLIRVAVEGGVERYVRRYEQSGYLVDPLFRSITSGGRPIHEAQLFSEGEWQRQPLRKALTMRRLVRMLEAPILGDGQTVGTLFFTRRPDEPPFSQSDCRLLEVVCSHVRAAVSNALDYQEAQQSRDLAQGVLQVIGAALVLSDRVGNIRFANRQAETFLTVGADGGATRDRLRNAWRTNLTSLTTGGAPSAVSLVDLPATLVGVRACMLLKSMRVPGSPDTVATFIYEQAGTTLDMGHVVDVLPNRERQVLELVAEGMTNKEIAQRLYVSSNTVKYHLKRLFATFGVSSRAELLSKAFAEKLSGEQPSLLTPEPIIP